jgi:hypothetical protein
MLADGSRLLARIGTLQGAGAQLEKSSPRARPRRQDRHHGHELGEARTRGASSGRGPRPRLSRTWA